MRHHAELGPIDYVIVEFPAGGRDFPTPVADSLLALVERGIIRVLDLLIVTKSAAGHLDVTEFEELDQVGVLAPVKVTLAEILAADDITNLARAIKPNSTAGVIVWENVGVTSIATAARDISAQVVAQGRIPSRAIVATLEADRAVAD